MNAKLAWDDFRLIKAIADHDGLTGAAAALSVNHSTVFRRLGQIEEIIGMPLFERRKTGYVATVAGAEMAALAGRMDEDVTAFSRRLAGRDIAPAGEIRITTTDTLHLNVLMPIFSAFRRQHPAIRLDVVIGNQPLNLSKRDADIAIRASDSPGETLVGRRVATLAWAIYGRADDGLDESETADPAALYRRDWVALGDQLSHVKAARFVREHVAPERIALKSSAVLGLTEAVEQGLGIGPLPCFIADQRPGLARLSPPNPDFATGLWVLTHPDIRHVPRVRAFMDFCGSELARLRPLFEGTD
ncbi:MULTISPECIES: LysR family transcriptional regulator [unclassified Bosea (in: a-proteobacteria)]|uniref:LysR family transcriptional regulator n=1 Tax=unclassified Bosea (in: a-proteobacteria) TaxID=2653178 RepID=UPI0009551B23|nr:MULTISPECIES: LysR family transcriptional regulator [unclassified Bosea (in: a-proteobacteria)]TAJ29613.1 MAG: LysR family transcriptional regulator [Bosea sp. (in: a-proteobacteria)]SIQ04614.1 transcriptional regulator, LysR family [Bosea sp. TND4EK4]